MFCSFSFDEIVTQEVPFYEDNTDAYDKHLSHQRKCTCAEDDTRWILCTVIPMQRQLCVFSSLGVKTFFVVLCVAPFERLFFSVVWVKREMKQKTASTGRANHFHSCNNAFQCAQQNSWERLLCLKFRQEKVCASCASHTHPHIHSHTRSLMLVVTIYL